MPNTCGVLVGNMFTSCGLFWDLYSLIKIIDFSGGKITDLYHSLYQFCTQSLNSQVCNFSSVTTDFTTLSTAPTIKTTKYKEEI